MRLILASGSPQRKDILTRAGYSFETIVPDIDERAFFVPDPAAHVERLSLEKARAVSARLGRTDAAILASDTVAVLDGEIIGKPADAADARRILRSFSGRRQEVYSGWALIDARNGAERSGCDVTAVVMKRMSEAEIAAYVESGEALGRAGAYAIQHGGDRFVERIDGSLDNVIGLPSEKVFPVLDALLGF